MLRLVLPQRRSYSLLQSCIEEEHHLLALVYLPINLECLRLIAGGPTRTVILTLVIPVDYRMEFPIRSKPSRVA